MRVAVCTAEVREMCVLERASVCTWTQRCQVHSNVSKMEYGLSVAVKIRYFSAVTTNHLSAFL